MCSDYDPPDTTTPDIQAIPPATTSSTAHNPGLSRIRDVVDEFVPAGRDMELVGAVHPLLLEPIDSLDHRGGDFLKLGAARDRADGQLDRAGACKPGVAEEGAAMDVLPNGHVGPEVAAGGRLHHEPAAELVGLVLLARLLRRHQVETVRLVLVLGLDELAHVAVSHAATGGVPSVVGRPQCRQSQRWRRSQRPDFPRVARSGEWLGSLLCRRIDDVIGISWPRAHGGRRRM